MSEMGEEHEEDYISLFVGRRLDKGAEIKQELPHAGRSGEVREWKKGFGHLEIARQVQSGVDKGVNGGMKKYRIPIDPVAKARPRVCKNGHAYTPAKTLEYERVIAIATCNLRMTGAVCLHMVFEMQMPKSWSQKKRNEMNGKPHLQRPDTDNLVKAVMDGMKGCWLDDSQVYEIHANKVWAESGAVTISVDGRER